MPNRAPPTLATRGAITPLGFCKCCRFFDRDFAGRRRRLPVILPAMVTLLAGEKETDPQSSPWQSNCPASSKEESFLSLNRHTCLRWGDTDASNTTRFCVSGSAGTGRSGSPSPTCGRLASVFARGLAQPIDQFKYLIVGQVCSYALDEHCGWVRGSFGGSRSGCFVSPRVFSSRGNPCGVALKPLERFVSGAFCVRLLCILLLSVKQQNESRSRIKGKASKTEASTIFGSNVEKPV